MNAEPAPRRLSVILALRMTAVAIAVSVLLLAGYFSEYALNVTFLRQRTLEIDIDRIAVALRAGHDPRHLAPYRNWPQAYGFRVFNRRTTRRRRVVIEKNAALLPPLETLNEATHRERPLHLAESFGPLPIPGGGASDAWMMTKREHLGKVHYWIQAVMIGDPAGRWRAVIANEMVDHVGIPFLVIVPALTLAMFLATRASLRPLGRIAREAESLAAAVTTGRPLTPLPEDGLPQEFAAVVAAINATLAKLERSRLLQKHFTSDVAHEVRTPLAVLLLEVADLPPGAQKDQILADLSALGTLVNELLRFAEAEEALAANRRPVDLVATARAVCSELAPVALRERKLIEFDSPERPVMVDGSATLIALAIRNLIENARKFTPPETAVSLHVEPAGSVVVEDRGPGVPSAQKERVFDRFWRAEPSRAGGSGVGLGLVRRIAQLHDGSVHVEDRPGGGARFVLSLTLASPG